MDIKTIERQFCDELLPLSAIAVMHGTTRPKVTSIVKENGFERKGSVFSGVHKPSKMQLEQDYKNLTAREIRTKYKTRDCVLDRWFDEYDIEKQPRYKRKTYIALTDFQKQFILGSLLGDASIVKKGPQHRLSVTHSSSQYAYILHKQKILGDISLANIQNTVSKAHKAKAFIRGKFVEHIIKETHGHILHSRVHPYFSELRRKLYPNNKKTVTEWWLNQITPTALAYWIMDDGSADYADNSYNIGISTYSFSCWEHLLIKEFFKSKYGLNMCIQPVKHRGCGFTIRFRTGDSKKLRDLVKPHVPECMQYKVNRDEWLRKRVGRIK